MGRQTRSSLVVIAVINLLFGYLTPGIDNWAHLGGLMGGFAVAFPLAPTYRRDNIRPALYDARYEAVVAGRMSGPPEEEVTLVGKYCESGDILVRDIRLPTIQTGDIVAIPSSGAYAPAMASNYNLNPRPAMVMVKNGEASLIRRRETYADMMQHDVF